MTTSSWNSLPRPTKTDQEYKQAWYKMVAGMQYKDYTPRFAKRQDPLSLAEAELNEKAWLDANEGHVLYDGNMMIERYQRRLAPPVVSESLQTGINKEALDILRTLAQQIEEGGTYASVKCSEDKTTLALEYWNDERRISCAIAIQRPIAELDDRESDLGYQIDDD